MAWYERDVTIPADAGPRVVLTFGAVIGQPQWSMARESLNTKAVMCLFLRTSLVWSKTGEAARITVRAVDRTDPDLPTGKQIGWYTQTGGIWQTVYLESRATAEIRPAQIYPDIDNGRGAIQNTR